MNCDQLSVTLHDAVIDLDTLVLDGSTLRAGGYLEDGYGLRSARFRFSIEFSDVVGWELEDHAQVGEFMITEFIEFDGGIFVESPLPMNLRIFTATKSARVVVAENPYEVRRFFRWRPFPVAGQGQ